MICIFGFVRHYQESQFQICPSMQCCAKSSLTRSFKKSPSHKWKMNEEFLLLIISVALTVIIFVLIAFIKKFIRSRPPGRRLVTSDIQVEDSNTKFRGTINAVSIYLGPDTSFASVQKEKFLQGDDVLSKSKRIIF